MKDWNLTETPHFKAVFTHDEIMEAEKNRQNKSKNMGINRRLALGVLTKNYEELKKDISKDDKLAEAMLDAAECIHDSMETAKADMEIYQSAYSRIFLVLGDIVHEFDEV